MNIYVVGVNYKTTPVVIREKFSMGPDEYENMLSGIIKSVGMDMCKLEKYQGFSADMAAASCLLLSSVSGIPVSTTHTKTTAIMGVGAAKRLTSVNWGFVKEMVWTWVLTFPGCGVIGYLMAKLFMILF